MADDVVEVVDEGLTGDQSGSDLKAQSGTVSQSVSVIKSSFVNLTERRSANARGTDLLTASSRRTTQRRSFNMQDKLIIVNLD